jgi:hypothetical protein
MLVLLDCWYHMGSEVFAAVTTRSSLRSQLGRRSGHNSIFTQRPPFKAKDETCNGVGSFSNLPGLRVSQCQCNLRFLEALSHEISHETVGR